MHKLEGRFSMNRIPLLKVTTVLIALTGCLVTFETVYLQNPEGDVAQCGTYTDFAAEVRERNLRNCVTDFQRAGYDRIPVPSQ